MNIQPDRLFGGPSFSVQNRMVRALWHTFRICFFRFSPKPCHEWRSMILRLWGAQIGKRCHIYPGAEIWAPWNLTCGDEVGVADGATLYNQAPIYLGNRSVISQGAYLCTGTHDYTSEGFELYARPIRVGDKAWVAAGAFVHPNVVIGEGVVVGAHSVVVKDLPSWTVCSGNPCVPIKARVMKKNDNAH